MSGALPAWALGINHSNKGRDANRRPALFVGVAICPTASGARSSDVPRSTHMPPRRALSVQSKLVVAFVSLTLASLAVLTGVGYLTARRSLTATVERHLVSLQRSKAATVRALLVSMRNEALALASGERVIGSARDTVAAYRGLRDVQLTSEMTAAVRRFYAEEFDPALAKRLSVVPAQEASLPTTPVGWYLHYHYLVHGGHPYGPKRLTASTTDASPYAVAVAHAHRALGSFLDQLGFDSLLFVDPETLDVVYSYGQSTLLGTNLADGPYSTSNVAAAVRALSASRNRDDYRVADFEEHRPRLGEPMAFITAPVFDGPKLVAIMMMRFRLQPIADVLSGRRRWEAEGLGKTGEAYLLGPDQTMRTESRFLLEDKAAFVQTLRRSTLTERTADTVDRLGTTILTVPVRHEAARAALRGQSGLMQIDDYRGVPVLMAYGPVDLDSVRWALIAKMDRGEAMAPLTTYARRSAAAGAALAGLASLAALLLASALTRPIWDLVSAARRVSAGELDVQVDVAADDEYRELGEAFNEMVRNLRASRDDLDRQVQANERLLQSLLPASAAAQVREGTSEIPQSFTDVTVAHLSLDGFDGLAREVGDDRAVALLSDLVGALDEAAEQYGVEKVRTIGPSYLAASGLSLERPDHTARMVDFAREAIRIVGRFNAERGTRLAARVRINSGPVIGGLIGRRRFIYDLWGDTVRLTRRMESSPAAIVVTRAVYERVREQVAFGPPTHIDVDGIGPVDLYPILNEEAA